MALQPQDRPSASTQVLRFRGTVTAGQALATFPKTNGTYTTGGGAGVTRGARFLLADTTDLVSEARQLPEFVYDDTSPAGSAPHAPVPTAFTALVVNAGEEAIGHGTILATDRTWCQNTHITLKSESINLLSMETENVLFVLDTLTSGLGLGTGLPVLILPVVLDGAAAPFDVDLLIEVRWSGHR